MIFLTIYSVDHVQRHIYSDSVYYIVIHNCVGTI